MHNLLQVTKIYGLVTFHGLGYKAVKFGLFFGLFFSNTAAGSGSFGRKPREKQFLLKIDKYKDWNINFYRTLSKSETWWLIVPKFQMELDIQWNSSAHENDEIGKRYTEIPFTAWATPCTWLWNFTTSILSFPVIFSVRARDFFGASWLFDYCAFNRIYLLTYLLTWVSCW